MTDTPTSTGAKPTGTNGVAIPATTRGDAGFRTFEVYQRERVGSSTEKIQPSDLSSPAFQSDPYPALAILREHYPCYRDWQANAFWITRYDDVTSISTDNATFETRSRAWHLGFSTGGRDLRQLLEFQAAWADGFDQHAKAAAEAIVEDIRPNGQADLAIHFAARLPLEILTRMLGIPEHMRGEFANLYWQMHDGVHWNPALKQAGRTAAAEMVGFMNKHMNQVRQDQATGLINTVQNLGASAEDLVVTLLESDHQTLHGGLANLWYLLLTHPEQYAAVKDDPRLMKIAWLESLRHSTPILAADRFARHEVERFGRLIPGGALLICSAAAANRDPRVFHEPDLFKVTRNDICHREARGQYRADGLATAVAVGLGQPSRYPAVPEDRPRSLFALTRDTALTANRVLIDRLTDLRLAPQTTPVLMSRRTGHMHTCWHLPVTFKAR